jgi:pyruvate formate lyase activating enzyme
MHQPYIFDIKRYAINDGPGIRVTIFFKGCPLSCLWCHNPESISAQPQKMYTSAKCIGCGECVKACPNAACRLTEDGIITDPNKCDLHGACARICPTLATEMSGQQYTVTELMKIIEKERHLFDQSGGGVTFSGGEPLLHPDFLGQLLQQCGERSIHRTIDTCGYVKTEHLLSAAKQTDLFLYDFKVFDTDRHKQFTGVDNSLILSNLQTLANTGAAIQIRIPLIRGVNSDCANIEQTAAFIAALSGEKKTVNLLPYHAIATHKHTKLGSQYLSNDLEEPNETDLQQACSIFEKQGLTTIIGG